MMQAGNFSSSGNPLALEATLAKALKGFAAELQLIDCVELSGEIANGRTSNIADIVDSAAELFFRPGSLRLNLRNRTQMNNFAVSPLSLDLVFLQDGVIVPFLLTIGQEHARVRLQDFSCSPAVGDDEARHARLVTAIHAARLDQPLGLIRQVQLAAQLHKPAM